MTVTKSTDRADPFQFTSMVILEKGLIGHAKIELIQVLNDLIHYMTFIS